MAKKGEVELNTYQLIRRTIARFVGTVCIALVLESLIMIIKYSQLDLAVNLYYPVGILVGTSALLVGMGLFLHLTRGDCPENKSILHLDKEDFSPRPNIENSQPVKEQHRDLRRVY